MVRSFTAECTAVSVCAKASAVSNKSHTNLSRAKQNSRRSSDALTSKTKKFGRLCVYCSDNNNLCDANSKVKRTSFAATTLSLSRSILAASFLETRSVNCNLGKPSPPWLTRTSISNKTLSVLPQARDSVNFSIPF